MSGGGSWVILCGPSRASRGVILTVGLGAASGRVDHTTQYDTSDAYYQRSSRSHVYMGLGRVLSAWYCSTTSSYSLVCIHNTLARVCMLEYPYCITTPSTLVLYSSTVVVGELCFATVMLQQHPLSTTSVEYVKNMHRYYAYY